MERIVVVVINNAQARFFTLEQAEWPEYESGPHLIEQSNLERSALKSDRGLWTKITKKQQEDRALEENRYTFDWKFAQEITGEIIHLIRIKQGQKLILIARPQIINLIHKFFTPTLFHNLHIQELPKDISYFSSSQIHQYLAQKQLVPACQTVVYPR
jgi:protein required for attachment to host cells